MPRFGVGFDTAAVQEIAEGPVLLGEGVGDGTAAALDGAAAPVSGA
jgi:hypothetical protein